MDGSCIISLNVARNMLTDMNVCITMYLLQKRRFSPRKVSDQRNTSEKSQVFRFCLANLIMRRKRIHQELEIYLVLIHKYRQQIIQKMSKRNGRKIQVFFNQTNYDTMKESNILPAQRLVFCMEEGDL